MKTYKERLDESIEDEVKRTAMHSQVGGDHYKLMAIQPTEYIIANGIGFCEGNVIKYGSRWKHKGGVEDLRKALHYIEMLIEASEEVKA